MTRTRRTSKRQRKYFGATCKVMHYLKPRPCFDDYESIIDDDYELPDYAACSGGPVS